MTKRKATKTTERGKVYEIVTDRVVELLESGTVPWHRPWDPSIGVPLSMSTRKPYRGINPFLLGCSAMAAGYDSPWWGTYGQIEARGGQVRKGEKSTLVVFWKRGTKTAQDDEGKDVEKAWAMLRYFSVFNAAQADGLELEVPGAKEFDPIEACQDVVLNYDGPTMDHGGESAFYSPAKDHVQMPLRQAFESAEAYYSTLFHELTHSTGHKSRLDREGVTTGHKFGDEVYSREELIAEMGAAMLAGICGIEQLTVQRHAAYVASWIKALKGDSKLVVGAAAAAQRAADMILGTAFEAEQAA